MTLAPMRKLIRSTITGSFLTKECTWTNDVRQAEDFRGYPPLLKQLHLKDVEFYYIFGNEPSSRYNFAVPLG